VRRRWLLLPLLLLLGASPADEVAKGQEAFDRGDHAAALVHWSLALDQARTAKDGAAELDALLRLSTVYREIGRLETAKETLDRAAGLASGAVDKGRVQLARGLLDLERGDLRKAEKAFREAFELHQQAADPHGAANAALDLGLALLAQGRDPEAGRAFGAAATLFSSLGDPKGRADALVNVGIVLRHRGVLREARTTLEEAVRLYREVGDAGGEADALANLGLVLQDLAEDDAARELYDAALATARSRRDVERQGLLLQNLGTLEQRAGRADRAREHYAAAEQAFSTLGKEREAASVALDRASLDHDPEAYKTVIERAKKAGDRRLEAVASLDLAASLREADPKSAAKHLERASALADALELRSVKWRALYLSGLLELDRGKKDKGIEKLQAAVDELERVRRSLDEDDSRRFVVGHRGVYVALIEALLATDQTVQAFVYAERLHLADMPDLPLPDDPSVEKYRALAAEEAWLTEALSTELDRAPEGGNERSEALRAQLAALRVDFAKAVDELRAAHPDFDQLVRVDPEDLEAVQGDLDPGVVVVQPILFEDRLAVLAFRNDRLVAKTVDVDGAEVERAVGRLVRGLRGGDVYQPRATKEACDQLGKWLLEPIAAELEGAKVVVVSADGVFRQLPFALLRREGRWLVEDVAVVGVTHVGSLRRRSTAEARFRVDGPGMLLLGNPDGSLPGAEQEVRSISEKFPGATVLTGAQASREALYQQAAGKKALHLATHGIIDPQRPDRSWLLLGPDDGGRLGYGEIPGLAPYLSQCRLVVLSACESGLPVDAPAPENGEVLVSINGLAAQFRRAGVETLVASLWRVDDRGTLKLMEAFYAELEQGSDVARALQRAQQRLISEEDWSHPWYWAGFVLVGDWR
jgi:CHAT domain-containing protein/Tfp pilus assembly protein PilF